MAAAMPVAGLTTADVRVAPALDLDELLVRARAGDSPAFAELVSRFERMVRGVVVRLTGDAELGDDLAQDVFMQLWKVLPAFTSAVTLPSWLKKVAVNAVISHWRHEESQKRRLEAMIEAFPPRDDQGPMAALVDEESRDEVRGALEVLPADLRSLLMLRIYENMSYEDLAASLDLEVGTVRSRLFRARQMMKDILERWHREDRQQSHPIA